MTDPSVLLSGATDPGQNVQGSGKQRQQHLQLDLTVAAEASRVC